MTSLKGDIFWNVKKVNINKMVPSVFEIHSEGFIKNDANRDIEPDWFEFIAAYLESRLKDFSGNTKPNFLSVPLSKYVTHNPLVSASSYRGPTKKINGLGRNS